MRSRLATYVLLVTTALVFVPSPQASACQCGHRPPADIAFTQSEVVIAGVVTAVEPARLIVFSGSSEARPAIVPRATLKVQKRWKGPAAPEVMLFALDNCAYRFEAGRAYLVFASSVSFGGGVLEATICLPTKPFKQAGPELSILGPAAHARP